MTNLLASQVALALERGKQTEALAFVDSVLDYCSEHENGKVFQSWDENIIRAIIAYHLAKKTLIVEYDDNGNIAGVFMWYLCDESDGWEFVKDWHPDKPNGDSVFLAFLFSSSTRAFKNLTLRLIAQEPDVLTKKLLGMRHRQQEENARRVTYTTKLFNKILKLKD